METRRRRLLLLVLVGPATLILLSTSIVPLVYSVLLSLQNYNLTDPFGRRFVGLYQFVRALRDPRLWQATVTTFQILVPSLVIELVLGIGIALLLNRKSRGLKAFRACILLPMMVTPVVVGLMWALMYNTNFGILNYFLSLVGAGAVEWLAYPNLAKLSLILVDIWQSTPFVVLIVLAGLQSLPPLAYLAARVDGATRWQTLRYITLPMLRPIIAVATLFRLLSLLVSFDVIYVLTGGGPGSATETLSMYIYKQGFVLCDVSYASALSYIFLVASIVATTRLVKLTAAPSQQYSGGGAS
ncbi:MAG: sugar ABC transporter permease [Bacillota bacterium]|nr:sugar ABC transporter permease [Bacillota bacterium]